MKTKLRFLTIMLISVLAAGQFAYAQLSGPKTIGGASPDYATFTAAISALSSQGVSGPVVFNVRAGNYPEKITIPYITGTSVTNNITFQGVDSAQTIINPALNNYESAITIDSAFHLSFKKLGIYSLSSVDSQNYCVKFIDNADNVSVENCHLNRPQGLTYTDENVTSGYTHNGLTFRNNAFDGVYLGIYINTDTDTTRNLVIEGNVFKGFAYGGISVNRTAGAKIEFNTADINCSNTVIRLAYSKHANIYGNNVTSKGGAVGIEVSDSDSIKIINNFIKIGYIYYPSTAAGIKTYLSTNVKIYHNTITNECESVSNEIVGINISYYVDSVWVHNNIISCPKGALALNTYPDITSWEKYDFNNFYTTNDYKAFVGDNMDSVVLNGFLSNINYNNPALSSGKIMMPLGCSATNGMNLLADVPNDYLGVARASAPSMGALEFIPGNTITGGDILVGKAHTYKTLSDALAVLQSCGDLVTSVRLLLTDTLYTEASEIVVDSIKGQSATNRLIIKPQTGVKAKIQFESLTAQNFFTFKTNYITIDGSNIENGTSRDLEILAPPLFDSYGSLLSFQKPFNGRQVISFKNSSSTIEIKNTIFTGVNGNSENTFVALSFNFADNISIKNNHIRNVSRGIYIEDFLTNSNISNNIIGDAEPSLSIDGCGIYILGNSSSFNDTLANNEIFNIKGNYDVSGIYIYNIGNSVIERNNIHDIATDSYSAYGMSISLDTSSNIKLTNNIVRHIAARETVVGIELNLNNMYIQKDSSIFVYHNSIHLSPDTVYGLGDYYATAKGISIQNYNARTNSIDLRNNIFNVTLGELAAGAEFTAGYAVSVPDAFNPFVKIDNNIYNVTGCDLNAMAFHNSDTLSLGEWQSLISNDANSNFLNPNFVTNADLHLSYNSPAINSGQNAGVTSDFNKKVRVGLPDIGAYEFEGRSIVSQTPSITVCPGENATLQVMSNTLSNFQWQLSTDGIVYDSILSNVSGLATSTYTIPVATTVMNGYKYRSIVSALGQQNDTTAAILLSVNSLPEKPIIPVGKILIDNSVDSSLYTITPVLNANTYSWSIFPATAGTISSNGTAAKVVWSSTYSGLAGIKVKGINNCDEGIYSDSLLVTKTIQTLAQFTYSIDSLTVTFNNQSTNADLGNWSFGDGNLSKIKNPVHTYKTPGFYLVCLKVFDTATKQTSDTCMEIQVGDVSKVCNAQFNFTVKGDSVLFENTSTGEFTDVFWEFGDGSYSDSVNNVLHIYTKPSYYEITLTVFNSETGCIDKKTKAAKVIFNDAVLCDAQFSYFVDTNNVSFTSISEGDITDYFWDFGDGTYSFDESPVHVFAEQGYFEVTLTTYSSISKCIDEISKVIFIYNPFVASCNASFSFYPKGNTVSFTSEATGAYSQHFWDFGNGTNSNVEHPVHTFTKAGYYEVVYTVIDTSNGCFDSRSQVIFVEGTIDGSNTKTQISAKYSYVPNKSSYEVKFKDESKGTITSWYWNFGDNTPASTVQHPVYVYDTNDYYRVCLTAGNSTNQKTKCKFIAVGDVKNSSTAFFTYFADTATATGHFKDKSLGNIASYYWDFGDGNTSTQQNPSHTYVDKGYYAVCLTTTSASGVQKTYCKDVRIDNSIDNPCLFSCVWPGDANNDLETNHYDIMTIGLNYGMQGPKRDSASIAWYGQFAQNWSTYQLDGTNNKYGDANGDGAINLDDVEAIKQNFAFSHYRQPDAKSAEWSITCVWDTVTSKRAGSRSKAKAILSPPRKGKATGIYAIGYEISVIGGEKIKWDSVRVVFDKSWIGEDGVSMLTVNSMDTNRYIIYIGMTRIDQQNITGSGEIATILFMFKDDVDETGVSFVVTSKGGIESSGEPTSVDGTIELALKTPVSICEGEMGLIDAGIGFASYSWSNGINDTSFIEVSEAGSYSVTVTDESGATAFATVEVVVNELPDVDLGADISQDGSLELDARSGFASYLWSTEAATQSITVSESGEYYVQVTNEFGCVGSDTINITITDINLELTNQIAVYPNPNNGKFWLVYDFSKTSTHSVEIINVEGKTVWHTEFIEANTKSNRIEVDNLEQGVYYLKVVENSNVDMVRFVVM
jgi:PKD repeat protein